MPFFSTNSLVHWYVYKIACGWKCFHCFCHIVNSKYKLGCGPESQFFDKDMTVCLENSFCSSMTFRQRTSAVLLCNWPMVRQDILIIKLEGLYWQTFVLAWSFHISRRKMNALYLALCSLNYIITTATTYWYTYKKIVYS